MCGRGFLGGGSSLWIRVSPQRMRNTPPHHKTSWHSPYNTKPRKAELRMFEKVTVTDAMAEDIDKLRPRLKNVHIRELVEAIIIMPKMQKPTFTSLPKASLAEAAAKAPNAPAHRQLNTPQKRRRIAPAWRCGENPAEVLG